MRQRLASLLAEVRACQLCAPVLPHGVRPVLQAHTAARILIVGQAPGRRVHESGVPFDDASGDRLRDWMGVGRDVFYDAERVAILPMGFCYPGTGKSGDLAPRPECAATWRDRLLEQLRAVQLTLVVGQYAMRWHLQTGQRSLTDVVRNWRDHAPAALPLPHPSPRNNVWLAKNAWFAQELLPELRRAVAAAVP